MDEKFDILGRLRAKSKIVKKGTILALHMACKDALCGRLVPGRRTAAIGFPGIAFCTIRGGARRKTMP